MSLNPKNWFYKKQRHFRSELNDKKHILRQISYNKLTHEEALKIKKKRER